MSTPEIALPSPDELSKPLSLDDLYKMTAFIYGEQNAGRPAESTFTHFVEVCGMLTRQDRNKPVAEIDQTDALCKALGWFFPLLAKFKVRSVEALVFRKYPLVCPYCREAPHNDAECKTVKGDAHGVVAHDVVVALRKANQTNRPRGLDEWQKMFQSIYPRTVNDQQGRSNLGLMEELGEFAEAIRVFDDYPHFLAGEAADVFSYLMGISNEHKLRMAREQRTDFSLQAEFIKRYPGMCIACGYSICRCPSIPDATVGRLAKELPLLDEDPLFNGAVVRSREAREISERVLQSFGGFEELVRQIPMDRGDANRTFVEMVLNLAERLPDHRDVQASLHRIALRLIRETTEAGGRRHSPHALETIEEINQLLTSSEARGVASLSSLNTELVSKMAVKSPIRILFAASAAGGEQRIRPELESRIVEESLKQATFRERFEFDSLSAATIDSFRRKNLTGEYQIVHLAGHGEESGFLFESADGETSEAWSYEDLNDYLRRYAQIQCLVLNACFSGADPAFNPATITVAMPQAVDDPAAIEFAKGFYDGLGAGKSVGFSVREGEDNARAHGHKDFKVSLRVPEGIDVGQIP